MSAEYRRSLWFTAALLAVAWLAPASARADDDPLASMMMADLQVAAPAPSGSREMPAGADQGVASMARCPFSAHNAIPGNGHGSGQLQAALAAGLRSIEVDGLYDAHRKAMVVMDGSSPSGNEPELTAFIEPLWKAWAQAPGDGYVLILDLKSSDEKLAAGIAAVLEAHAGLLSSMDVGDSATFRSGKITVCLSGDGGAKAAYARLAARSGRYLAFADQVFGGDAWKSDTHAYFPKSPPAFQRFVTMSVQNCMEARAPSGFLGGIEERAEGLARKIHLGGGSEREDTLSQERVRQIAHLSAQSGYAVRVYTVNASTRGGGSPDRAVTAGRVEARAWQMMVDAGMPMIATDDYQLAADWWRTHASR